MVGRYQRLLVVADTLAKLIYCFAVSGLRYKKRSRRTDKKTPLRYSGWLSIRKGIYVKTFPAALQWLRPCTVKTLNEHNIHLAVSSKLIKHSYKNDNSY